MRRSREESRSAWLPSGLSGPGGTAAGRSGSFRRTDGGGYQMGVGLLLHHREVPERRRVLGGADADGEAHRLARPPRPQVEALLGEVHHQLPRRGGARHDPGGGHRDEGAVAGHEGIEPRVGGHHLAVPHPVVARELDERDAVRRGDRDDGALHGPRLATAVAGAAMASSSAASGSAREKGGPGGFTKRLIQRPARCREPLSPALSPPCGEREMARARAFSLPPAGRRQETFRRTARELPSPRRGEGQGEGGRSTGRPSPRPVRRRVLAAAAARSPAARRRSS